MRERIIEIYQNLQESELIQKERENSERAVKRLAERMRQGDNLTMEEISEELYELVLIAEENGFVAGFRYAVRLMKEC